MENLLPTVCLFTIYLWPFVVLISRENDRQKSRHRLATEYAGVDKLLDYLWSATKDGNQRQKIHFPWQQSIMLSTGQQCKNNGPLNVGKAHSNEWKFYSIKKSRGIM